MGSITAEQEAIEALVREHYAPVYRFCARRIGPTLAQDAAQETFLTAQRSLARFDGRSSVAAWLFGIAHNHCRNIARKGRHEAPTEADWLCESAVDESMEKTLIDRQALRQALGKLSQEHREVVLLHEVEGLTYAEAASVLGVPEGTVKSRLHHAFLNLRTSLLGGEEVPA
ncbi:MAG TPA: RNA polymerase sigma factor [Fimbriimonadaceae bacterium]|nr:RNA polymerase sigma factor [Fimbriimonadaceae bacterium]